VARILQWAQKKIDPEESGPILPIWELVII